MAESERYDVVVIGDDLAGVMAGALLAEKGLRVRLLDTPCAGHRQNDPLVGLFTAPTAKRLIETLEVGPALRSRVEGPAKGITVALPDRRFVLPPVDPERRQCLRMMFPDALDELTALLHTIERYGAGLDSILGGDCILMANTYLGRRTWRRYLAQHPLPITDDGARLPNSIALRQLIDALLAFLGHPPVKGSTLSAAAARALWHVFHGVIPYRDGRRGFRQLFVDRMRQGGGVVTGSAPVESLEVKWRRARAAVLEDGTRVEGRCFLIESEPLLGRIWRSAPAHESLGVQRMRVRAPASERPDGLRDPCAWIPSPPWPGCHVRVDDDGFQVRWRGRAEPPPVSALSPLGDLSPDPPQSTVCADDARSDPHGVYRRPLVGPLKNLGLLGEWILPGLGLESSCLSAWHGAQFGARFGRRRSAAQNP